jgi:hypothetical protein
MNEQHRDHQPEPAAAKPLTPSEIPTLPLPSTWRLIVGGIVILAFLFFMYRSYSPDEPPVDPAKTSLEQGTG